MNNFAQLVSIVKNGGNPIPMIQQMAQTNPKAALAMQYIQGKNSQQLQQTAINMVKGQGLTVEQIMRQMGLF